MRKYGQRGILYSSLDTAHAFCNLYLLLNAETDTSLVLEDISSHVVKNLIPDMPMGHLPIVGLATDELFPWTNLPTQPEAPASAVSRIAKKDEFGSPAWVSQNIFSGNAIDAYPTSRLSVDFEDIFQRRSAELFSEQTIDQAQVVSLVRGLSTLNGFKGFAFRIALRNPDYTADLFEVQTKDPVLLPIGKNREWDIVRTCMGQRFLGNASAALAMFVPGRKTDFFEAPDEFRRAILNAGYVAQQAYLLAAKEKLGICAVGGYSEDRLRDMMGLSGDEPVLYLAALGVDSSQKFRTDRGKIAFAHGETSGTAKDFD
ncbi:nitroreductase family protein [Tateyamaria omphalii]|uniref:nitroreductase family protein n=1 Tax=Tateyamaria omphalii TaxID=299262 RepID=UPI00167A06E9|nr:nitroreductase family protein [Tateyamaria omphalii]